MNEQNIENNEPALEEQQTPAKAPDNQKWYGDLGDDDLMAWADNKGFADAKTAFSSYRHLEKFVGADKAGRGVIIPKDGASDEEWGDFYTKLGRPESPEGYKLPVPEGQDDSFAKEMATLMHKANIPAPLANNLANLWNEYNEQKSQEFNENQTLEQDKQIASLNKEWGGAHDANVEIARKAARNFGLEGDQIDKIQSALGYDGTMKLFHNIGSKLLEDKYIDGGTHIDISRDAMTPARAKLEYENFKKDPANYAKLENNDYKTQEKLNNILKYLDM
jgi:hypothetical protein